MKIRTSLLDSAVDFRMAAKSQMIVDVLGPTISRGVQNGVLVIKDANYKEMSLREMVKDGDFVHICLRR